MRSFVRNKMNVMPKIYRLSQLPARATKVNTANTEIYFFTIRELQCNAQCQIDSDVVRLKSSKQIGFDKRSCMSMHIGSFKICRILSCIFIGYGNGCRFIIETVSHCANISLHNNYGIMSFLVKYSSRLTTVLTNLIFVRPWEHRRQFINSIL